MQELNPEASLDLHEQNFFLFFVEHLKLSKGDSDRSKRRLPTT
jgi:hypothetical protein